MGGAPSSTNHKRGGGSSLHKSETEILRLMFPVYYTLEGITHEERKRALDTWNLVLDDKSPEFLANRGKPDFPYTSCVTFFYDSFYTRLFDIHPMCKQLFKNGMRSQGKFLVKMISLAMSELEDPEKFDKNLVKLAEIHYQRGVKAVEYGIVGEVLFWVMKRCLGTRTYSQAVHAAWVKIYSRMLRTIVPVAISYELKSGKSKANIERFSTHDMNMFSMGGSSAPSDMGDEVLESEKVRTAEPTTSKKK